MPSSQDEKGSLEKIEEGFSFECQHFVKIQQQAASLSLPKTVFSSVPPYVPDHSYILFR